VKSKTSSDIDEVVKKLTNDVFEGAKTAKPITSEGSNREITFSMEIRKLVQQRVRREELGTERVIQQIKLNRLT